MAVINQDNAVNTKYLQSCDLPLNDKPIGPFVMIIFFHAIILEGGIDENNNFFHIKIKNTADLCEAFRVAMIKLFVDKKLMNEDFAKQFLQWKNSGFSVDNSVFLAPNDDNAREGLCQYIARYPASLKKIVYEPVKKKLFITQPTMNILKKT